ncbi:hypothetical protein MtrunA17_Chr1g0192561 [Medicago truncatula]|uniref:DUF3511 domain protein n=1 Tax=Medicago truncatula TaxID=3880 RepID=A0A072VYE5_MEDTR|nr:DUF3511 domain protein [Medicago truncatula]RHN80838.1 hypothetical protein MtrunA17_Chr1g0192561 [Medicago truncatula]
MEVVRHRQPRSLYGAASLYNQHGRARTLHEKEIRVARSRDNTSTSCYSNYEPSPPRNRVGIVSNPFPQSLWWNDKDSKRKRRVATYRLYAAQGKLKSSLQKGYHRFKIACKKIVT